ncbi:MAG: glycosyltransferase, partial [Acidimicrobiales bacterium]
GEKDGYFASTEDAEAFVTALQKLLENPGLVEQMGRNARLFVESWPGPAEVAEAYERLFFDLIDAADRG